MKTLAVLALLISATSANALELWTVQQGSGPTARQGTWQITVQGDAVSGGGNLSGGGKPPMNFGVTGKLTANGYQLQLTGAGPDVVCIYHGAASRDGKTIGGAVSCGGQNAPWSVTVKKS